MENVLPDRSAEQTKGTGPYSVCVWEGNLADSPEEGTPLSAAPLVLLSMDQPTMGFFFLIHVKDVNNNAKQHNSYIGAYFGYMGYFVTPIFGKSTC